MHYTNIIPKYSIYYHTYTYTQMHTHRDVTIHKMEWGWFTQMNIKNR